MSVSVSALLQDFSVEITGKDADSLNDPRTRLPEHTRVNVTFLGNESPELRTSAARAVRDEGLVPVPHISARRITSRSELEHFLGALQEDGTSEHVFVVAGDPAEPQGPYEGALSLITTTPFESFGVRTVSVAGYPEGHPDISDEVLWSALTEKSAFLAENGNAGDIVTQFGFDVDPVIAWIERVRAAGIHAPIRVGVPGPAGVRRLLGYARRFGVGSSASIVKKYGFSLTNLLSTAGPDRFIADLASQLDPEVHGVVRLHFYTFGGLGATSEWITEFLSAADAGVRSHS